MNIDIIGEIDRQMLNRVRRQLEEPADKIDLIVESEGGSFDCAVEIYARLLAHPARKTSWIGQASSGALLVAVAADRRVAVHDAQILLHRSAWANEPGDEAVLRRTDREIALILEARTGRPAAVFLEEMTTETDAPLSWCLETNILTEIDDGKISHTAYRAAYKNGPQPKRGWRLKPCSAPG